MLETLPAGPTSAWLASGGSIVFETGWQASDVMRRARLSMSRHQHCVRKWVAKKTPCDLQHICRSCRALRRKVGGTAKDYWKDWIDVSGDYTDKGYVSRQNASVPGVSLRMAMASAELLLDCIMIVTNCNPDIVTFVQHT